MNIIDRINNILNESEYKKFEVGKFYQETMTMADKQYTVECISRTDKFVVFKQIHGGTFRKKISTTDNNSETVYTNSSVISAKDVLNKK